MARSSRACTRFSSSWPAALWRAGSRATTTLDLPLSAFLSIALASPNLPCAPSTRAPVAASFMNSRRLVMANLTFVRAAESLDHRPSGLKFRFHPIRQGQQGSRCVGIGFVRNNAHQIRALAEDHALRVLDAGIAQLNGFRVLGEAGLEDLAGARGIAHRVHIDHCFQLALIFVVGSGGGDDPCLDVLFRVPIDVLPEII